MRPLDPQRFQLAVRCLALLTAETRVVEQMRADGLKVSHFSCVELQKKREAYFDLHREELINKALVDIWRLPMFARYRPKPE
jgi:hypothetical protein